MVSTILISMGPPLVLSKPIRPLELQRHDIITGGGVRGKHPEQGDRYPERVLTRHSHLCSPLLTLLDALLCFQRASDHIPIECPPFLILLKCFESRSMVATPRSSLYPRGRE